MKSIIATTALVAATSATEMLFGTADFKQVLPKAKVVNRCPYDVYLWSVDKELGCTEETARLLKTGGTYQENFRDGTNGGISIKLSKFETCGGKDITQLEYKIEKQNEKYAGNYLDMSFVDCTGNLEDCPGRTDGFYLRSGNQGDRFKSAVNNEHCPVFNVYNAEEAARVSYIKWDDRQTKFCDMTANLELYLCGGDAPGDEDEAPVAPSSSAAPSTSAEVESSSAQPTSSSSSEEAAPSPSPVEDEFVVAAAAAVTKAPAVTPSPVAAVIKTEVVYVTKYVKARHAHGRRHQQFHA
jgi:hypothetical protein